MIEIPLFFVLLFGVVLASVLIAKLPVSRYTGKQVPLTVLQEKMGLGALNSGLFFLLLLFWAVLFVLLFGGLIGTIYATLTDPIPFRGDDKAIWNWRFSILKLASLTAVLGAVVALPFTLMRLNLSRQQVNTALEALTNDKMDIAVADLHAQRQITRWDGDTASNGWQDDITRRNGAIDRLLGLVEENEDLRPRVDRLLTVYLRELTREFPAEPVPEDATPEALRIWANGLTAKRSDMENAVQVLSRLPRPDWAKGDQPLPDLQGINMQGFKLSRLFLQHANLSWAELQGANLSRTQLQGAHLSWAKLQGTNLIEAKLQGAHLSGAQLQGAYLIKAKLQGADLSGAELQGADLSGAEFDSETSFSGAMLNWAALRGVNLSNIPQITEHLNVMFGDRSVTLPDGVVYPDHWPESDMDWNEFEEAWRDWQRAGGFDPDNPQ